MEWQPIETAPKDGREVILAVEVRAGITHGVLVGHYMPGGHCIEDHPPIDQGWYFWNGFMFDKAARPTHWMPMPNHPQWAPDGWQAQRQAPNASLTGAPTTGGASELKVQLCNEQSEKAMELKYPESKTSIDDVCEIIKFFGIKKTECTDCTILYEVTFDQLRAIYNLGKDHAVHNK